VKRTLKGSADVDLRGRVRREEEEPMRIVKIRLVGGPAGAGIDLDVPDPGDFLNYGGWKWSWAGKSTTGGRKLFAKKPTSREEWQAVLLIIGHTGRDPRLSERMRPFMYGAGNPAPPKHGRGKLRRAARKNK
jgi:hypothetical protein